MLNVFRCSCSMLVLGAGSATIVSLVMAVYDMSVSEMSALMKTRLDDDGWAL